MNPKKIGLFSALIFLAAVVTIGLLMLLSETMQPIVENVIMEHRVPTQILGNAPGGLTTRFYTFMIYPHQANPATAYASNLSNVTAYEYSDAGNTSASDETPYSTAFDIYVKVGVTNEDGAWTNNGTWNNAYTWCLSTCTGLSIGANTNMSEIEIAHTAEYRWIAYYLNNAGSGYTIVEGQSFNVTAVKFYVQRII